MTLSPRRIAIIIVVTGLVLVLVGVAVFLGLYLGGHDNGETELALYGGKYIVRGTAEKISEKEVWNFTNVPYAEAGVLEYPTQCGSDFPCHDQPQDKVVRKCMQRSGYLSETIVGFSAKECLVLTIRTTELSEPKLPVVVWIHGGGLLIGDGVSFGPQNDFAVETESVVVAINYRLDNLGYFASANLNDTKLGTYGNYGHEDQITALRWIKDNIAAFGGDPKKVTLVGESAGGTSILALMASKRANNLFHNAIPLSPATQWLTTNDQESSSAVTTATISRLGCDSASDKAACIRGKNGSSIILQNPQPARGIEYFFFPKHFKGAYPDLHLTLIDGKIVEDAPINYATLSFKPDSKIKVFLSNTAQELYLDGFTFESYQKFDDALTANLTVFQEQTNTDYFSAADIASVKSALINSYNIANNEQNLPKLIKQYQTLISDLRSTCPTNYLAEKLIKSPSLDVYRVYFDFEGTDFNFAHAYDVAIGFGHVRQLGTEFVRRGFVEMIRSVAHDNLSKDWGQHGNNTLRVTTTGLKYKQGAPQNTQCELWKTYNGMNYKFGWQN